MFAYYEWGLEQVLEGMVNKEIAMAAPYNDMDKRAKWEAKEKAVNGIRIELENRFRGILRGSDFESLIRRLVTQVEIAQNY